MLSRTSARQLRMRQQTLNEDRMSQSQNIPHPTTERRSSGSKLIISSPTPPLSNISLNTHPVSQSTPINDNSKNVPQFPVVCSGASALLAFLSGADTRRHASPMTAATSSSSSFHSPHPLAKGDTSFRHTSSKSSFPNVAPDASSLESIPNENGRSGSYSCDQGHGFNSNHSRIHQPTSDSSVHFQSGVKTDSGISGGVLASSAEQGSIELDSNLSPASSDLNSVMESCFDNIMEDQEGDNFDLNNITPSIHLSSAVGVSNDLLGPNSQHGGSEQSHPGICIVSNNGSDKRTKLSMTHHRPMLIEQSSIKASTSCPAEMEEVLHPIDASPVQLGSYGNRFGTSGSGGSLTGTSGGTESGVMGTSCVPSPSTLFSGTGIPTGRGTDDQRAAWVRDRTKKDSHNRIERKRRDYINCQISELGNLLPDGMFRDGDCKKNKGSILKNSVEFICLLRAELSQLMEIRKEALLAAKVIGQLVKHIQELENMTDMRGQNIGNVSSVDYQRTLQEWLLLHEHNLQLRLCFSPVSKHMLHHHSEPAGESSSPGLSSIGTEELVGTDAKSVYSSPGLLAGSAPIPSAPLASGAMLSSPRGGPPLHMHGPDSGDPSSRTMRTRCTSLTVAGTGLLDYTPGAVRFHGADIHSQVRGSSRVHPAHYATGQAKILHPAISEQTPGSIFPSQSRQWQQSSSFAPSFMPSHVSHHGLPQLHHMQRSRPMAVSSENHFNAAGLSASLPANVNPLMCREGSFMNSERMGSAYCFERKDFLPPLKCEPPSELDPRRDDYAYTTDAMPPTLNMSPGQLESLVVTVPSSRSMDGGDFAGIQQTLTTMNSSSHGTLEMDEFRFDDVPME